MSRRIFVTLIAILVLCGMQIETYAQFGKPRITTPDAKAVSAAYEMAEGVFNKLKEGKTEEIATWLVEEIGYAWDASTRVRNISDYKGKLDAILLDPPESTYGKLAGYDLIEESSLPGSDRYFRLTYITYHSGAPLIWEFRFYVKPGGKVALQSFLWNTDNPFEFLATGDMQLLRWYGK